jgi:uncharacterized protein (DUF2252 family)
MTPYAAAKFVNEELKKVGIEKSIPTQMMYNYTSARMNAGKKPFIEYTIEEGINEDSLKNWTTKYIAKKVALAKTMGESRVY